MMMTIISRETIKPSSPTSSHLHTYNLSEMDLLNPKTYIPLVLFYPNNNNGSYLTVEQKAIMLKKSLSQSLTRYYPFAGRLPTPTSSYVVCNDDGVLFLEARNDRQLDTIQCMISSQEDALDQLFADDLVNSNNTSSTSVVAIQLTHFACGGLALAISLAHAVGDACTLSSFLTHWASVARYGSINHANVLPLNPYFVQSPRIQLPETGDIHKMKPSKNNMVVLVSKKFVFTNSKLSELKNKVVVEAGGAIYNPTRVEVLTSLLFKTVVASTTTNSGCFKSSYMFMMMNVRDKLVPKLPQSTVGNLVNMMTVETKLTSETPLSMVVAEIRKTKKLVEEIQSVPKLIESTKSFLNKVRNEFHGNKSKGIYMGCSSLCGFPFNKLDFGWGKPMGTAHAIRSESTKHMVLMDTPDDDGIEVMMFLEKECMQIFENDKEMLSYCHNIVSG